MSKFTEWLVDKGYTTSEDKETIESEISGPEADTQYNELHTIYEDGKFYNQVSLTEIRKRLNLI